MTEDEFMKWLDIGIEASPKEKHLILSPTIADAVRRGEIVETEHFRLIERDDGVFIWEEK